MSSVGSFFSYVNDARSHGPEVPLEWIFSWMFLAAPFQAIRHKTLHERRKAFAEAQLRYLSFRHATRPRLAVVAYRRCGIPYRVKQSKNFLSSVPLKMGRIWFVTCLLTSVQAHSINGRPKPAPSAAFVCPPSFGTCQIVRNFRCLSHHLSTDHYYHFVCSVNIEAC